MTDIDDLYPSKYLKPVDLAGKELTVQIANVAVEEIGQSKDRRAVISFVNMTKRFVANKTNLTTIAKLYGPNFAGWVGKWVVLYATTTSFGGETVACIRIRAPRVAVAAATATKDEMDDEIPL